MRVLVSHQRRVPGAAFASMYGVKARSKHILVKRSRTNFYPPLGLSVAASHVMGYRSGDHHKFHRIGNRLIR